MRFSGMNREWTTASIVCMLALVGATGSGAQTSKTTTTKAPASKSSAKAPSGPSTLSGVYTDE
jgi:hypothetical protein